MISGKKVHGFLLNSYINFVVTKPAAVIAAVLIFTAAASLGLRNLRLDSDMLHWFSRKSPIAELQYRINDTFRVNNPTIIMLEMGNVFTPGNLNLIKDISSLVKG